MNAKAQTKRIYLVNRDFQFRYTRIGVMAGLVSTMLTSVVILYPLFVFKILVVPQFLPTPILLGMIAAALINILMIVMFGILITHRIAGPMFSMVRHIRKMASGQWHTVLRSRTGDDLQLLVRNLNDLSNSLVTTARQDLELVHKALETCTTSPATAIQLQELQDRIQKRIETAPQAESSKP